MDPDVTMDDLPWGRPPHSVGEALGVVIFLTLAIRGVIALLAYTGPWPQSVAEWDSWLVPLLIGLLVGVGSYVLGRHKSGRRSASYSAELGEKE